MPSDEYKMPRIIDDNGDIYINLDDVIEHIKSHGDHVKTGRYASDSIYELAHAHIIDMLSIYKQFK